MSKETVKIIGQYSEGCFCEGRRRDLRPITGVQYRPFYFVAAAKEFASKNGLTFGGPNKDRSAWAIDPKGCAHRPEQRVRIDWALEYGQEPTR